MAHGSQQIERIERLAASHGVVAVRVGAVDLDGVWRGKRIPMDVFTEHVASHGTHLCAGVFAITVADEVVPGLGYCTWGTGFGTVAVQPDLDTFALTPWVPGGAAVLGDFVEADGTPTPVSPRHVLRAVVDRLAERGLSARIGYELEFHLFAQGPAEAARQHFADLTPLTRGMRTYNLSRLAELEPLLGGLTAALAAAGIEVEAASTEFGPGQFELNLPAADPITAADRAVLFKHFVREIAATQGLSATFMAKCDPALAGSSGHIHQSLWDAQGRNLFARDPAARDAYLAGLLATMAELGVLFCPNVNSYKRLAPGSFAPTTATWGRDNRTVAVRVVEGDDGAYRLEHRLAGADANPYLTIAACLAGGLYGLERDLVPPAPIDGDGYEFGTRPELALPRSLAEATARAEAGTLGADLLGKQFMADFLAIRRGELAAAAGAVTDWERHRYFELI